MLQTISQSRSETWFRLLTEHAPVMMWVCGVDKAAIYFNRTWLRFTGRPVDAELGSGWMQGVHPQDFERCMKIRDEFFAARHEFEIEYRLRRFDGEYRWILDKAVPVHDDAGKFAGYIGSCTEIHASKELHLLESQRARLFNRTHAIMQDCNGAITYWSDGAAELYGWSRAEVLGRQLDELMETEFSCPRAQIHAELERTGQWQGELSHRRKDGQRILVASHLELFRDDYGRPVAILQINNDITERRQIEERLNQSEKRLALALHAARLKTWTIDFSLEKFAVDKDVRDIFGIPPADPNDRKDLKRWDDFLLPEDKELIDEAFRAAASDSDTFDLEYRAALELGETRETRWIDAHAVFVRDAEGHPTHAIGVAADITERKQSEQRIADTEKQLRLITDSAPVYIARYDNDGRFLFVNKAYADRYHAQPEQLVGKTLLEVIGGDAYRQIYPYVQEVLAGKHTQFEIDSLYPDLDMRSVHASYVPELDANGKVSGFVAIITDITDRKMSENILYKREREFKTLVENSPDVIARVDRQMRHLYINPAAAAAFGIEPQIFIGKTKAELGFPASVTEAHHAAAQQAFETGAAQAFDFNMPIGAETRHYTVRMIPELDRAGTIDSVLAITYDVTQRTQAEQERDALLIREKAARAQAEAAAHARDQFVAMVSHELRSPLNGIHSWTHVLEKQLKNDTPVIQRALSGIKTGVHQQVRLIDDLLDTTLVMTGKLRLIKQPVCLRNVIDAALESVRHKAAEKKLRLEADLQLGTESVNGDPDRLQQILWNLLTNAIKFTPEGGLVELSACCADDTVEIVVKDNGKGIPADFLPHLFDPFRQADVSNTRRAGGIGLGLTLVRRLTELHGGRVMACSMGENRGATFTLVLPLLGSRNLGSSVSRENHSEATGPTPLSLPSLQGLEILLIDDQKEARDSLCALLTQAGARVKTAESGPQGLQQLLDAGAQGRPDVLICDVAMPEEDGYTTLGKIRHWEKENGIPAAHRLPAIALTAFAQRDDRMRALTKGFQMHLAKPVEPAELLIVISTMTRFAPSGESGPVMH